MSAAAHLGLGIEALVLVGLVLLVRWAVTGGQPQPRERKPAEEWWPAYTWIPAQELAATCPDCGTHITIHTAHGGAL